jgi:Tfp pilus assembly protein PilV
MKLVKTQRGNLLMQSAVALLIGALSVAGVIYFLGYINSAKTQAAVEQLQGFSIAVINEAARSTPDAVPAAAADAFYTSNNIPLADIDTTTFAIKLATGDSSTTFTGTSAAKLSGSVTPTSLSTVSALVKAANAGYIQFTDVTGAVQVPNSTSTYSVNGVTAVNGKWVAPAALGTMASPTNFVIEGSATPATIG